MKLVNKSDPITGYTFEAIEDSNGNLIIESAFCGTIKALYDGNSNTYKINADLFTHRITLSLNEAADYLQVNKVRVSRMCKNGTLKSVKINGTLLIDKESIDRYLKG